VETSEREAQAEDVLGDGRVGARVEVLAPDRRVPVPKLEKQVVVVGLGELVGLVDVEGRRVSPVTYVCADTQVDEYDEEDGEGDPGFDRWTADCRDQLGGVPSDSNRPQDPFVRSTDRVGTRQDCTRRRTFSSPGDVRLRRDRSGEIYREANNRPGLSALYR